MVTRVFSRLTTSTLYRSVRRMSTLILSIGLAGTLCGPARIQPPTCDDITAYFDEIQFDTGAYRSVEKVEVYIDASVPMRNFVRGSESVPKTLYSELLEFLGSNPWNAVDVDHYSFGESEPQPVTGARGTLSRPANDRSFYDQGWTHLGELVTTIRQRMAAGDWTVRFIVTDLVQANEPSREDPTQSNWVYLAGQIRETLRHGDWQLLGFRSLYQGRHYPESGGGAFEVYTPVERPFYLMVFGPSTELTNRAIAALMEGELTRRWSVLCRRFRPKSQMVRVSWRESEYPDYIDERAGVRNPLAIRDDRLCERVLSLDWIDIENQRDYGCVRTLLCFESDNPAESFVNIHNPALEIGIDCFAWNGLDAEAQPLPCDTLRTDFQCSPLERPLSDTLLDLYRRHYWLEYQLRPSKGMGRSSYYIYRFALKIDPMQLRLPQWVEEWSTNDDCGLATIGQTLNLKPVLGSIVRSISADEPLFTGFFLVQGR